VISDDFGLHVGRAVRAAGHPFRDLLVLRYVRHWPEFAIAQRFRVAGVRRLLDEAHRRVAIAKVQRSTWRTCVGSLTLEKIVPGAFRAAGRRLADAATSTDETMDSHAIASDGSWRIQSTYQWAGRMFGTMRRAITGLVVTTAIAVSAASVATSSEGAVCHKLF
jgi:hypothetical protein